MKNNAYSLLIIFFITMISCSLKNQVQTVGIKTNQEILLEFEEINHTNLNLINTEYQILNSQEQINMIYKKINDNNLSPRKNPIPSYNEEETYIVLQPQIKQSDFTVEKISKKDKRLKIKIQQYSNPEFKGKRHPISIIKLNKKNDYNSVEFNR